MLMDVDQSRRRRRRGSRCSEVQVLVPVDLGKDSSASQDCGGAEHPKQPSPLRAFLLSVVLVQGNIRILSNDAILYLVDNRCLGAEPRSTSVEKMSGQMQRGKRPKSQDPQIG